MGKLHFSESDLVSPCNEPPWVLSACREQLHNTPQISCMERTPHIGFKVNIRLYLRSYIVNLET